MESYKALVLAIKKMNHFVLRKLDNPDLVRFNQFENLLQESYEGSRPNPNYFFKVGAMVAVNVPLNDDKTVRRWLRGVIRDNCKQKNLFFVVHFGDYGFETTCMKLEMRPLYPFHSTKYFPFQMFHFFLTDVDYKMDIKSEDVYKEIKSLMEKNNFVITITIEGKDKKGSIYGSVLLEEDCDLAAVLLEKQLVEDVHYCNRYKKIDEDNSSNGSNHSKGHLSLLPPTPPSSPPLTPHFSGPYRSAYKAGRALFESLCKCNDVIKYKRKLMRDKLKDNFNIVNNDDHQKLTKSL